MIDDAELLDTTRRLRQYMVTLDSCHVALGKISNDDDKQLADAIIPLLPDIIKTSMRISHVLKIVENSRHYKDMLRKYNIKDKEGL